MQRENHSSRSSSDAPTSSKELDLEAPAPQQEAGLEKQHLQREPATGPPPPSPGPPPNGGFQAWLHVVGGFMLFFNTWGLLNTFAYFQTYYESGALFDKSSSNIAWIGSIQAFLVMLVGALSGPIYDRGYLRALLLAGSFFVVLGLMMLSLCKEYWQVLLAQGFCVGIGAGLLFVPCISVLPTYFSTKIGLAVGIASSGSSLGGVIYPIVLYRLIGRIGFPWAVRSVAFISLGTLLIPITVMRVRIKSPKPRAFIDYTTFRDPQYMTFVFSTFLAFIGLTVCLFYIPSYANEDHITTSNIAFYLVPIYNAGSCFGRVVPNAISDKVGPFNIITPSATLTGIILLCMIPVDHPASIIVLTVLAGIFSGVLIAMPPVCFVALTENKALLGTRIGMGFAMIGVGILVGGPAAGAILGTHLPLDWSSLWAFGGVTACAGGAMFAVLRVHRSGVKLNVKA